MRAALAIAAVLAATPALAAPKGKAAKAAFDRGVAAYTKGDFAGASEALGQSYKLEPDVETLFAWAQSERQQDKCESAIDLYDKLLETDMPAENKDAVRTKLEECKAIIAAKAPVVENDPEPEPQVHEERVPVAPAKPTPWWKDPIGDALTIGGLVALGAGGYFLYSGKQAEDRSFENEAQFADNQDKAASHGKIGVILTLTGGALIVGGIVRYVTRDAGGDRKESSVTGWMTADGGGVAAFGRF